MCDITVMALGGVRENGKNLYVIEIDEAIFVLDAGLKYPESEQLGVDVVIPNLDYLIERQEAIQGIFLTHGHADAIGALPYLITAVKAPVFGSELTIELAKLMVKKNTNITSFDQFHVVDSETEIEFANTVVSFFKTTHSIPESLGIVLGTKKGNIVYTGDFKFDPAAQPPYQTDLARLAEIGNEGVLALLSDSANALSDQQMASEAAVSLEIIDVVSQATGRVIVAAVSSNLSRIQQVLDAAVQSHRKVLLTGFDIENVVRTALRLNKLTVADTNLFIKPKDMNRYANHELLILETGRMGEPINGLEKMARGRHRQIHIQDGDLVYVVTTPSIAKEAIVARVENLIYKSGGTVKTVTQNLTVSGHANARDLQFLLHLIKPTYFFPIQGEYRNLAAHAKLAEEVGISPNQIFILKNGFQLRLNETGFLHEETIFAGDVMIDGNAIGDVGNIVLRDRKILSEDGIFVVVMTVNKRERRIVAQAKVNTRGFIYIKKSRDILREAADLVNTTVEEYFSTKGFDWSELKAEVRDELGKFLFEQTKRRPAILPVIMEVR